jgi:putative ABC transport system substrate-binding protein
MPLVAFLNPRISEEINIGAFRRGLHELGYVEGKNIAIEARSAEGDNRRLPALAAELVALKPDVIVTSGELAARAAKEAAGTIPIVMAIIGEAVALGFAQSLSHTGGNMTGLTILDTDVLGKRLQMLHEIVADPAASRCWASQAPITATRPKNLMLLRRRSGWRWCRSLLRRRTNSQRALPR